MTMKVIFAGFRHDHIFSIYDKVQKHPELEIAASCEEDDKTRAALPKTLNVEFSNYDEMLKNVPCDIVAVGDYYSKRGQIIIKALRAGKHVISDKPLCTDSSELDEIARLAKEKNLKIGCQLDLPTDSKSLTVKDLINKGVLGDIHMIQFGGQHPLMLKTRPTWYFEDGKQGGTINDIAVHAIDLIPRLTGLKFTEVIAARTWNAFAKPYPQFNDAAQFMLKMDNGCGVMGDVSYAAPDSCGYATPFYWRFTIWGTKGVVEFNNAEKGVRFVENGRTEIMNLAPVAFQEKRYFESFIADIKGAPTSFETASILDGARETILVQDFADKGNK